MKEIAARFKLDVALMPVTSFRLPPTMGEKGAARAVEALAPKTVIPIHMGIVPRSPLLRTRETPERFAARLADAGSRSAVKILREGESFEL